MFTADFFHRYNLALAEIHDSFDLTKTENAIVKNATLLFGGRGASLILTDTNEKNLILQTSFGLSDAYIAKGAISPSQSLGETISKTPVLVQDIDSDPRVQYREAAKQEGIASILGLPLSAGSALVGSLRLYFAKTTNFSLEELECVKAFGQQVGLALKKSYYYASMKGAVSEIQKIPTTNSREALKGLLKIVSQYGLAMGSALLLIDYTSKTLTSMVRYGLSDRYIAKGPIFLQSLGEVTTGQPVIVPKVATDPRVQYKEAAAEENVKAILGLPVMIGGHVEGALRLYYPFEFTPGPDYITWMQHLAYHVGIAVEKSQVLIKLQERSEWYEQVIKDLER